MRVRYKDKIWDKEAVQALIDNNDAAVSRALIVVYNNQTMDEKRDGITKVTNGIGFTGRDAEFLTDIARKWNQWGRWASQKQLNAVRRCIRKYHKQLLMEMAEKPGAEVIKGRLSKNVEMAHQEPLENTDMDVVEGLTPDHVGSW